MKKNKSILAVFALFLAFSVLGSAQTTSSAIDEFAKLKSDKHKIWETDDSPRIVLSVLTQKLSDNSGKVDFIIYGKMNGYKLDIQPIKAFGSSIEAFGDKTSAESKQSIDENSSNTFAEPTVIIPISEEANGLEITWSLKNSYQEGSSKILIPIDAEAKLTTFKITLPRGNIITNNTNVKLKNSFVGITEECNCLIVEISNTTCGTICKYCSNLINNILDGINCKVTCGTECTNRFCRQPECGVSGPM